MTSLNTMNIIATKYPVKSVMILKSSKAEVVRAFDVTLKKGQNKVSITRLPSMVDTQSVRISGLNSTGSNRTYLSDVVCSTSVNPAYDAGKYTLRALAATKDQLASEKKVHEILIKYANTITGEHTGPDVMNDFLSNFLEQGKKNIQTIAKVTEKIQEIERKINEEKRKASSTKGTANTELTAIITAEVDAQVNLKLTYIVNNTNWVPTYELNAVTGENGQPSRTVSLHYRACITQSTGEDWTDASLTLSTVATDTIIKCIPALQSVRILTSNNTFGGRRVAQPAPPISAFNPHPNLGIGSFMERQLQEADKQQQQQQRAPRFGAAVFGSTTGRQQQTPSLFGASTTSNAGPSTASNVFGSANTFGSSATNNTAFGASTSGLFGNTGGIFRTAAFNAEEPSDSGVIALPESGDESDEREPENREKLVTETPMALTYAVRGKSSIPSDGKEHIVTIAVLTFQTDVEYVSVPRIDARVYVQCQVKNNSDYRLLPGPVSIILDDSYVSKTTISDVNRNDTFKFTLGDDPSILMSYSRLYKSAKEGTGAFAEIINATTYTVTITAQNKHGFPIEKLFIRDALPMPLAEEKRVKVLLRKPKELIDVKEGVFVNVDTTSTTATATKDERDKEGDENDDENRLRVKWEKEKDGLYEYKWRIDADDKIKLETVYEIKAPADVSISFDVAQLFGQRKA